MVKYCYSILQGKRLGHSITLRINIKSVQDVYFFFVKSFQLSQYQWQRLESTTIRKSVKCWFIGRAFSIPSSLLQ